MTAIMQLFIHIRNGVSLVMNYIFAVRKHLRLGIILALACLACVLSYVPAVSQTSPTQLPNPLKLGVRTSAYPIGNNINEPKSAGGFCGTFGKELQKELASNGQKIQVKYFYIRNQHKGVTAPRYYGLKTDKIDIECGPNSILSGKLPTGEGIEFSNSFYETGVKILLKEELAEDLNSEILKLEEIKIGVVKESTTLEVLKNIKNLQFVPYNSGREALNALGTNKVQAFASDALIVSTLLKEGVKQPGQPPRKPYEKFGYTIYPNSSSKTKNAYLTSEPTENYAMVVKKNPPLSDDILKVINKTLDKSEFSRERQKLKDYQTRSIDLSWNEWKNLLRFINSHIWVVLIPFIWALFIQFLSQLLHESWLTTFTWVSGITVCLLVLLTIVIQIILMVIPRVFPGY